MCRRKLLIRLLIQDGILPNEQLCVKQRWFYQYRLSQKLEMVQYSLVPPTVVVLGEEILSTSPKGNLMHESTPQYLPLHGNDVEHLDDQKDYLIQDVVVLG